MGCPFWPGWQIVADGTWRFRDRRKVFGIQALWYPFPAVCGIAGGKRTRFGTPIAPAGDGTDAPATPRPCSHGGGLTSANPHPPNGLWEGLIMNGFETALIWGLLLSQTAGLLSAVATRLGSGSACHVSTRWLFSFLLSVVALGMVVSLDLGPTYWLTSGTTFSIMVLTVTCDFGDSRRAMAR